MMNKKKRSIEKEEISRFYLSIIILISSFALLSSIALIFSASAVFAGSECDSIEDCPISQCTGSVVLCENNLCKYSACILETGSINKEVSQDEYFKYSNDIVDNINISKLDIKTERGFYESVLEWATFNKMVLFSIGLLGGIFLIIIVVLLWQMIKTNPVLLIFALTLILLLTALVAILFVANPDIIDRMAKGDFSFLSESNVNELTKLEQNRQDNIITEKSFSKDFYKAIDQNIDYAKELKIQNDKSMTSVIMLQFNNENSVLTYIDNKIKSTNSTKRILGKLAYIYDIKGRNDIKTYRIVSKNKIFLITGTSSDVEATMGKIFSDTSSEARLEIEFEDKFCQNSKNIEFKIFDQSEIIAINNFSVVVSGTGGFTFNEDTCRKLSYGYDCNFTADLNIGKNMISINIVSYESGVSENKKITIIQKKSSEILYDPIPPQAKIDILDKGARIRFTLSDTGTGIDFENVTIRFNENVLDTSQCITLPGELKTTCTYQVSPVQGQNNISEKIRDRCENYVENDEKFMFDTTPPKITVITRKPKVIEIYDQSGIKAITIDKKPYDPNECLIMDDIYTCTISSGNVTSEITVEDIFSNKINKII